ncbi:MAG: riboflavin synthase [Bacteroidota bacterium]|jgi:riboflavin synthase
MFTGIVENTGIVKKITQSGSNKIFTLTCPFVSELKIDQSVCHNGVCLTISALHEDSYEVTAISETLQRTSLGKLKVGEEINLERCLKADGRFDGHIVQGHVDETAICNSVKDLNGSWEFEFEYSNQSKNITVEKGSICVNGVSLTVVKSEKNTFSVHIIPYTFENTCFKFLKKGDVVNLEFDILGKYIQRILNR